MKDKIKLFYVKCTSVQEMENIINLFKSRLEKIVVKSTGFGYDYLVKNYPYVFFEKNHWNDEPNYINFNSRSMSEHIKNNESYFKDLIEMTYKEAVKNLKGIKKFKVYSPKWKKVNWDF